MKFPSNTSFDEIFRSYISKKRQSAPRNIPEGVNTEEANTQGANTVSENTDGANTNGVNTDGVNTDSASTEGTNTGGESTDSANTDGGNTDGANTGGANTDGATTDGANTNGANTDSANTDRVITDGVNTDDENTDGVIHKIYYCNQFGNRYKTDERIIKNIVFNSIKCINRRDKVELIIYYKSPKLTSLVTRNDQSPKLEDLQKANLIYEFKCNSGDCEHLSNSYVTQTQTSLSRRLTIHKSSGAPKKHLNEHHNAPLTRELLVQNTKIIRTEKDPYRLQICEALLIQTKKPSLNIQTTGMERILKLHDTAWRQTLRRNTNQRNIQQNNAPHQPQRQSTGQRTTTDANENDSNQRVTPSTAAAPGQRLVNHRTNINTAGADSNRRVTRSRSALTS